MRRHLVLVFLAVLPTSARAADCRSSPEPAVDWSGCDRSNLMLPRSDLTAANLEGANVSYSDLRSATLSKAKLTDAKLTGTSLAGSVAAGADFTKVEAYRSDFSKVSATGASFRGAELQRARFSGAALSGSSFAKAELGRVAFDGARLGGNDFAFANLARADLSKATIEGPLSFAGAYMFLTHIEGSDLSAATGLAQAQIDIACGDAQTKLPAGLKASAKWPCHAD